MIWQIVLDPGGVSSQAPSASTTGISGWVGLGLVAFVGLVGLIVLIQKAMRAARRPDLFGVTREQVLTRWKSVQETSKQGTIGMKVAVIEADSLLDAALKSLAMPGETMGERLKVACYRYPSLQQVWSAHKLRNQLAHDTASPLSMREGERALQAFWQALKTLNIV